MLSVARPISCRQYRSYQRLGLLFESVMAKHVSEVALPWALEQHQVQTTETCYCGLVVSPEPWRKASRLVLEFGMDLFDQLRCYLWK